MSSTRSSKTFPARARPANRPPRPKGERFHSSRVSRSAPTTSAIRSASTTAKRRSKWMPRPTSSAPVLVPPPLPRPYPPPAPRRDAVAAIPPRAAAPNMRCRISSPPSRRTGRYPPRWSSRPLLRPASRRRRRPPLRHQAVPPARPIPTNKTDDTDPGTALQPRRHHQPGFALDRRPALERDLGRPCNSSFRHPPRSRTKVLYFVAVRSGEHLEGPALPPGLPTCFTGKFLGEPKRPGNPRCATSTSAAAPPRRRPEGTRPQPASGGHPVPSQDPRLRPGVGHAGRPARCGRRTTTASSPLALDDDRTGKGRAIQAPGAWRAARLPWWATALTLLLFVLPRCRPRQLPRSLPRAMGADRPLPPPPRGPVTGRAGPVPGARYQSDKVDFV